MKKYNEVYEKVKKVANTVCDMCKSEFVGDTFKWKKEENGVLSSKGPDYDVPRFFLLKEDKIFYFDICPECFETKFIPYMKETFNAEPEYEKL